MSRVAIGVVAVALLAVGLALGIGAGSLVQSGKPGPVAAVASPTAAPTVGQVEPTATPAPGEPTDAPTATPARTPEPTPTPAPTPVLVPAPLTGVPVQPDIAARHVIGVMIDDQFEARPQSGLSSASVVWQAPAEGGIPRYLALFQEGAPPSVGPIRSSRLYFIAWAAEWNSVYIHAGGSPQAMAFLRTSKGKGRVVWDADANRYEGRLLFRVAYRNAPHNLYSNAQNMRRLVTRVGAKPIENPEPNWQFAPDAPLEARPVGGRILVPYPANKITYTYDRRTNTYPRTVSVEGKQLDAGPKKDVRIAPKNVVVMVVPFVPIGDAKHRLDGKVAGEGPAWIATNGQVIKGIWRKRSFAGPTRFFDKAGNPVTLTIGQTFINVVPRGTTITIKRGTPPPAASPAASPTPSPAP